MTSLQKGKEIYKYNAPWTVYSMNWCQKPEKRFKLALGSFIEDYNNLIQIVTLDDETGEFYAKSAFDHPYPTTKIIWIPDPKGIYPDLLATSGDYLRVWRATETNETKLECLLNNNKGSGFCAPLTSFDWNEVEPTLIGTCSIDTTCTIWNLETGQAVGRTSGSSGQPQITGQVRTQLIAHDKEVCDIAFSKAGGGRDMFASVGADGSVRMFDLRHLDHSTIIYEEPDNNPLVRLAWNKQDENYLGTFAMHGTALILLDIRVPCKPVAQLSSTLASQSNAVANGTGSNSPCVNGVVWAPHSPNYVCTASEDRQALIWDLTRITASIEEPILAYGAAGEINQVQWSSAHTDWIAICYNNTLEILKV